MKTMKRFLATAIAVTSVMAIAPMSAFAENETGGTTNVKFNAVIEPAYTITIPASVTLSGEDTATATITAKNVYLDTTKHKQINVILDSASNTESGSTFHAKNSKGDSTATYTIGKGTATTGIAVGDTVASFENNPDTTAEPDVQTATLTFSTASGATYAGTHTETLTFGIEVEDAAPANPYAANVIGDVVQFGNYNWYIIGKSDNGVTLLMQNTLSDKAYNNDWTDITWENCSLRSYLNDEFYKSFSADDKAKIALTHNSNPNNPNYGTSGGNETDDHIYLLSIAEANALDSNIRNCGSWWWLRSPGNNSLTAAVVDAAGNVPTGGRRVVNECGVRPALNLKF